MSRRAGLQGTPPLPSPGSPGSALALASPGQDREEAALCGIIGPSESRPAPTERGCMKAAS